MNQLNGKRWFEKHPTLLFVAVIVIAVLFVDFISAMIFIPEDHNDFRCPDPYFHHGLLPNRQSENIWGDKVFEIFTNSLGFKDYSCREVLPSSEKRRIIFIGDSFTEGMGMTWEESFAGIVATKLPETEILNAGVVSYSPKLYYLKIKFLLENLKLKFDELYVFIDNSDPLNELTYESFEPYDHRIEKQSVYRIKRYLYKYSYLYYSVSEKIMESKRSPVTARWNPMSGAAMLDELSTEKSDFIAATLSWSYNPDQFEKWGRKGLGLARENMQKLTDLCKSNDIQVTIVIYPWPSVIEQRNINDIQVGFWESFCESNGIPLVNLYGDFITNEDPVKVINRYFIPGDVHWNQEGNQLVAEKVMDMIKRE